MNTQKAYLFVLGIGALASAFVFGIVFLSRAQADENNISFPVAELGNCKSKDECKTYCDKPGNVSACIAFAEKNNLMTKEELSSAKKFLNAGAKGPGGCTTKDSCESYCNDIKNIDECVAFAEKTGILPPNELKEAKQVQSALSRGVKPPACKSKKECDSYCDKPDNMKECIAFAESAGFLQGKELEDAKKMLSALEKGIKPLPCRGKEQCESYCSDQAHIDECVNFAVAAGFMSEKDAEMARKTGGKGPGGCKSKEECDLYCENNQDACFNFAREHGLISAEDLQKMEEGNKRFNQNLENAPPEVKKCLEEKFGDLNNLKLGEETGKKMKQCFEQFDRLRNMHPGDNSSESSNNRPQERNFTGPGGCKSPEECESYCKGNPEACKNFSRPGKGPNSLQEREPRREMPPPGFPQDGGKMPPPGMNEEQFQGQIPPAGQMPPAGQIPPAQQIMSSKQMPPGATPPGGINPNPSAPVSLVNPASFFFSMLANIISSR